MLLLQNNLKTAFRMMEKNKLFSSITVFGLSVSITACFLIFQYTFFELSYDKQFSNNIYRVGSVSLENGVEQYKTAITPIQAAPLLKDKLPEVAEAVRLVSTSNWFNCTIATSEKDGGKIFNEKRGFYFVDPAFTSMFQIQFLKGDSHKALIEPFSIVLSESIAKKYFGQADPLGKTLRLHGSFQTHDYTVTGIMNDFPVNSHLDVTILASLNSLADPFDATTYTQLQPKTNVESFNERMNELVSQNTSNAGRKETQFMLEQIGSIHLSSDLQDQPKITGSVTTVYFLMIIGLIVLIMAWMNYLNLTTARFIFRVKEVGIRKVTGASRNAIGAQFLTESFLLNSVSFILAIIFFSLTAPMFYRWIGLPHITSFSVFSRSDNTLLALVLTAFIVGIFACGFFPALFFARLNPVKVLKGKWQAPRNGFSARKAILFFQFLCTLVLAIVVVVFQQQFTFLREQPLGVNIKRSIVLTTPANVDSTFLQKLSGFKDQLKSQSIIHSVTTSTDVPGNMMGTGWGGSIKKSMDGNGINFGINVIDPDFIKSYQLKLLAGRDFTITDFPGVHFGDKPEPVILNRKGAEVLSFRNPDDALGATIYWGESTCVIVGVIEEFHTESLKKSIQPMLYTANMGPAMTLKLTEGADKNIPETMAQIKEAWQAFFPDNAFDYFHLEDQFNQQYDDGERVARLFNLFCLLAFSISGLGLFGLSLFTINARVKEISIRKILGAPFVNLLLTLSREYLLLIVIASMISIPLAYFGMNEWLNGFAIKIELNAWYFIIPIATILFFALATVLGQTMKAIIKNPIESLKNE